MFRTLTIATTAIGLSLLAGCAGNGNQHAEAQHTGAHHDHSAEMPDSPAPTGDTVVMTVAGMGCPLCAANADKSLMSIRGVTGVDIDLGTGKITIGVDRVAPPSTERLRRAVIDAGFTVQSVEG